VEFVVLYQFGFALDSRQLKTPLDRLCDVGCVNAIIAPTESNQTRSGSQFQTGDADRFLNSESHKESCLSFSTWLHSLEASEHLLALEAKTSHNAAWCKGVLGRWRAAGYPDPEQWPETQSLECLRPSYSLNHSGWPNPPA
jgi:hypothetical protein